MASAAVIMGIMGLFVWAASPLRGSILFNVSPSEPRGFYIRTGDAIRVGDIIAFKTPSRAFPYADRRLGFLHTRPILKAVAAGAGTTVCTTHRRLAINGVVRGPVAETDRAGDRLPQWGECRPLRPDEWFVYSERIPNSFDSRYFGPVRRSDVMGVYRLVLPWPDGAS